MTEVDRCIIIADAGIEPFSTIQNMEAEIDRLVEITEPRAATHKSYVLGNGNFGFNSMLYCGRSCGPDGKRSGKCLLIGILEYGIILDRTEAFDKCLNKRK